MAAPVLDTAETGTQKAVKAKRAPGSTLHFQCWGEINQAGPRTGEVAQGSTKFEKVND